MLQINIQAGSLRVISVPLDLYLRREIEEMQVWFQDSYWNKEGFIPVPNRSLFSAKIPEQLNVGFRILVKIPEQASQKPMIFQNWSNSS